MERAEERFRKKADGARASGPLADFFERIPMGVAVIGLDGRTTIWNAAAERILGRPRETVIGGASPVPFEDGVDVEHSVTRADGAEIEISCSVSTLAGSETDGPGGKLVIFSDITERKKNQRVAEHREKMESLGVLAGGIAHGFNNLLTGILGNAGLGLYSAEEGTELQSCLQEIVRASERASALTRQLLAYAGKGRMVAAKLSLSDLVRDTAPLAQSSIRNRGIRVRLELDPRIPSMEGDPGQLQQVILSLIINAAESMDTRAAAVEIVTRMETLVDGVHARGAGEDSLPPGRYAVLEVKDSGTGMDDATLQRIFEPFFSTKFTGRGMGLPAALGIVRQHRGTMRAASVPGQGSTFRVYLPVIETCAPEALKLPDLRGGGLILVADDEESVRTTVHRALQFWGYDVVLAENGQAAVELFSKFSTEIRAVIIDLIMPVMGGEEAITHLRSVSDDLPVVLMSGYSGEVAPRRERGKEIALLQKPFTAEQLGQELCNALDRNARKDGRVSELYG